MTTPRLSQDSWKECFADIQDLTVDQTVDRLQGTIVNRFGVLKPGPNVHGKHRCAATLALAVRAKRSGY